MREECSFFCPIRVRYNEVDIQGIVYNGNYFIYTDIAFSEFILSNGSSYKEFLIKHPEAEVCHVASNYVFKGSAFEDDLLEVGVRILKIGTKSFSLGFEIYRQNEDALIVEASCVYSGYDSKERVSRPIAPVLRTILEMHQKKSELNA